MIELPRWDAAPSDADRCLAQVDTWAEALRDSAVVSAFSERAARGVGGLRGAGLLDALEQFASEHWDFRHGRERNLAVRPNFSAAQIATVEAAAAELGLMGTVPPRRGTYDAVVMTGGMVRAGIVKPRYLRELYDGGLTWAEGVFLGGFRPFAGDEVELAPLLGVDGDNEFDSMSVGLRTAFELGEPVSSSGFDPGTREQRPHASDWREERWLWNGRMLRAVAAPSSDPENRRANTVDTYRFWASRTDGVRSVLVVTTPIYVPYQGAAAIEVLGIEGGLSVETVAVSATASDLGEHSQSFLPQHHAQELRSAIHGLRSLRSRLCGLV